MKNIILSSLLTMLLVDQVHIAQCIYFEARGEGEQGWKVVMASIKNRVRDPNYPNTIYGVIWQPKQYSWTHDGKSDVPKNKKLFHKILTFVKQQPLDELGDYEVTHYHHKDVRPYWADHFAFLGRVGDHLTYREI